MENLDMLIGELIELVPTLGMLALVGGSIFLVMLVIIFVIIFVIVICTFHRIGKDRMNGNGGITL